MNDLQHSIKRIGKRVLIGAFLLITINVIVYSLVVHYYLKAGGSQPPAQFIRKIADRLQINDNNFQLDSLLLVQIKEQQMWVMLLDDKKGNIRWAVDLPKEIPDTYTLSDISSMAKFYLKDYPVVTWKKDDGLLVAGYPKDSYARYNSMQRIAEVKFFPVLYIMLIFGNIFVLILVYVFIDHRMSRSLKGVLGGIQKLSNGESVQVKEKGMFADVASCLNRTSGILHKRSVYRENWIAGVSHDVRTPLSVILARAGQLEEGNYSPEETREQALYIRNQALQLRELIDDLNLFSQLENGTRTPRKETFHPVTFFRQTIATFLNNEPRTQRYQVETIIAPGMESTVLHGDARLLARAINNLLYNSIRHTPEGTTLTLSLKHKKGRFCFTVADNGDGVSPEYSRELQTLAQGSLPDVLPGQEHGLGLSIVCQIVKMHKGEIFFRDLQPHGFSTEIRLPD